jgi:RNA polymerase sigma-70 factor (ECF subfamily)
MTQQEKTKDEIFQEEAMPHLDALFGAAMKYTKSQRDAEDLVQDTLLKAYSHFDKYTPGTNCKAWLFRIQTNTFINRYRKKKRSKEYLVDDSESRPLEERAEAKPEKELEPRNETHKQAVKRLFGDEVNEAL